jgi:hypothetical protein
VQAANAATIAAVATRRGLPERAVTIALATAMQESQLRNISHGDRDSAGLFQQRPSQGWGTLDQIQDPVYSAGRFYDHLNKIPGYSRLPLTVAAQRVQRSGFPQAYAKHETNAILLTDALTGRRPAALSCTTSTGNADKKPGDPERVRQRLVREFGRDVLADGIGTLTASTASTAPSVPPASSASSPASASSASSASSTSHIEDASRVEGGSAVSVPAPGRRQGWELAHWAIANAEGLRIERISYDGREWSAGRSHEGWRRTGSAGSDDDGKYTGNGAGGGTVELQLAPGH